MQALLVRLCCFVLITGITLLTSVCQSAGRILTCCSVGGQTVTVTLESVFFVEEVFKRKNSNLEVCVWGFLWFFLFGFFVVFFFFNMGLVTFFANNSS